VLKCPSRQMRTLFRALAGLGVAAAAVPARAGESLRHDIAIDARGPLALVEVTRALPAPERPGATETLLDIALPDHSVLVGIDVRDRGRWRAIDAAAAAHEPHRIAFYLFELASGFHALWTRGSKDSPYLRFIMQDDREITLARLALVEGIATVLSVGLGLLGVGAPSAM